MPESAGWWMLLEHRHGLAASRRPNGGRLRHRAPALRDGGDELSPDESAALGAEEMADAGADHHRRPSAHAAADRGCSQPRTAGTLPVYYSLGNFLSHTRRDSQPVMAWQASRSSRTRTAHTRGEYERKPCQRLLRDQRPAGMTTAPMLLERTTPPELAAQNRFTDCTVEAHADFCMRISSDTKGSPQGMHLPLSGGKRP